MVLLFLEALACLPGSFSFTALMNANSVKQELRSACCLRAQLGQCHTAIRCRGFIFVTTLSVLDNSCLEPSSRVTGKVSDLSQWLLSHSPPWMPAEHVCPCPS